MNGVVGRQVARISISHINHLTIILVEIESCQLVSGMFYSLVFYLLHIVYCAGEDESCMLN